MPSPPTRAIFNSLAGAWTLRRTLKSALPAMPSGTFVGTATLTPHSTPNDTTTSSLLYSELGEFTMDSGLSLGARQSYIYQYSNPETENADGGGPGTLSVWFVKQGGSRGSNATGDTTQQQDVEVDYLFHEVMFDGKEEADAGGEKQMRWTASGDHLCIKDNYAAEYEFCLAKDGDKLAVKSWTLKFDVKGPKKDYVSESRFYR